MDARASQRKLLGFLYFKFSNSAYIIAVSPKINFATQKHFVLKMRKRLFLTHLRNVGLQILHKVDLISSYAKSLTKSTRIAQVVYDGESTRAFLNITIHSSSNFMDVDAPSDGRLCQP